MSNELRERIKQNLLIDDDIKKKLLSGDVEIIRKIGVISQTGIKAKDIVYSYENNEIEKLYKRAKQMLQLQQLYNELCEEYYAEQISKIK